MNKGLEVIEAHWLFGVAAAQIDVVVHPQSIVHSLVEFTDGSMLAQLGMTDMRMPIQYAFSYPERWTAPVPFLDLTRAGTLEFLAPAWDEFPCLGLAFRALEADRSLPIVLNASNEVAVASFLEGQLAFTAIPDVIAGHDGCACGVARGHLARRTCRGCLGSRSRPGARAGGRAVESTER